MSTTITHRLPGALSAPSYSSPAAITAVAVTLIAVIAIAIAAATATTSGHHSRGGRSAAFPAYRFGVNTPARANAGQPSLRWHEHGYGLVP